MATLKEAVEVARNLKSEHGENPEYDRALVELIRDLFGVGYGMDDGREHVELMLDIRKPSGGFAI